jgi:hypothetical protein
VSLLAMKLAHSTWICLTHRYREQAHSYRERVVRGFVSDMKKPAATAGFFSKQTATVR